jgi:hypothetical protein
MPVTGPPQYKGHLSQSPFMLAGVKALLQPAGEEVLAVVSSQVRRYRP